MGSPTSRLLELLELLQTRPLTTGREIADQLGVDARTARRYIGVLQELGIPIEGQRGVGGGYRIRPGYRLPPLMLGDEEAVVVVLGLLATRGSGSDGSADAVDGALAKINRVLPATLRRQVEALEETLGFTVARGAAPADAAAVLLLADGIRRRRRVHTAYRTFDGDESERELSPHGLVVTGDAGTSPPTTTCATTCAPSESTGCGARRSRRPPRCRRPRASTPSST
jgi:predicted DNA-binding transcriptional regulator YafY